MWYILITPLWPGQIWFPVLLLLSKGIYIYFLLAVELFLRDLVVHHEVCRLKLTRFSEQVSNVLLNACRLFNLFTTLVHLVLQLSMSVVLSQLMIAPFEPLGSCSL